MTSYRRIAAASLVVVMAASPAFGGGKDRRTDTSGSPSLAWQEVFFGGPPRPVPDVESRAEKKPNRPDLSGYAGLGSWVDIFNHRPWEKPVAAVATMRARGAKTIYLQTSTYGQSGAIYDDEAIDEFLHHAHKRDMKVVAWYVPSFAQQKVDLRSSKRAIDYRSPTGERFDSFALDIEATHVGDIATRNMRLLNLSKRIRRHAGRSYPLGAITPDPIASEYWPRFPYKGVAKIYDVFVPMAYFTFRAAGYSDVRRYTQANIRKIRRETGDREVPIHMIGGIAGDAGRRSLRGFVKASRELQVAGASLYDYPITDRMSWYEMRALSKEVATRRRAAAAERQEAEAERRRRMRRKARERKERQRELRKERQAKRAGGKKAKDDARQERRGDHGKRKVKERRSPSSSASPRDKGRSRRDGRERRHHHDRDRRPR